MEDLVPLGVVLNFGIEELRPFDAPEFEVLGSGGETHFDLSEHKRGEIVISALSVVVKWLANSASCSTMCQIYLRVGCPTISSSGTASILPLIISVMAVTVAVISDMIAPFLS